jgi:endonuclease YncB( thermonuclease family)
MYVTWLLLTIILLATPAFGSSVDFIGPIVSILDGDTLEVQNGHHTDRIRLSGIDFPEKGQASGKQAKQAASDLAFGKDVTIQTHSHDKYQRTLANVILSNGTNLNQELVKQGFCWWYRRYVPGDTVLEGLEKEAREGRKGLD